MPGRELRVGRTKAMHDRGGGSCFTARERTEKKYVEAARGGGKKGQQQILRHDYYSIEN